MTDLRSEPTDLRSDEAQTERIVRSGTIWTGVGVIAPAAALGPLLASGWRPTAMPLGLDVAWWVFAVAAAAGLGLLIWAGCPALGDSVANAARQKVRSVRNGIVMNVGGMALAGLAVLLSPR